MERVVKIQTKILIYLISAKWISASMWFSDLYTADVMICHNERLWSLKVYKAAKYHSFVKPGYEQNMLY